jgi:N-methylhydantoinase B
MRYAGQGHEVTVELPDRSLGPGDTDRLTTLYRKEYRRLYSRDGPDGGLPGGEGSARTASGEALHPKRQQRIPGGERVVLRLPGGGGHGDPFEREPALVTRDVEDGLVSAERARDVYGVVLKEGEQPGTYTVDAEATARHRKEATPGTDT